MSLAAPNGCELDETVGPVVGLRAWVDVPVSLADGSRTEARMFTFRGLADGAEHLAIGLGEHRRPTGTPPLVRLHSECLTGDVLGSRRCDCGPQLDEAMVRIRDAGGYLLYLRQEGRGIGLYAKVDAYRLQDHGLDTFEANRALGYEEDGRDYRVAAQMLHALGVRWVDLLTGNAAKTRQLEEHGVGVRRVVPTGRHGTPENGRYLDAKLTRGHRFASVAPVTPAPDF